MLLSKAHAPPAAAAAAGGERRGAEGADAPPWYAPPRGSRRRARRAQTRRCAGTLSSMRREAGAGPRTNTGADRSSEKHVASRTWSHAPTFLVRVPAEKSAETRRRPGGERAGGSHVPHAHAPLAAAGHEHVLSRAPTAAHTAPRWPASTCVMAPETGSHKRTRGSPVPHATSPCVAPPRPRETAPRASSPSSGRRRRRTPSRRFRGRGIERASVGERHGRDSRVIVSHKPTVPSNDPGRSARVLGVPRRGATERGRGADRSSFRHAQNRVVRLPVDRVRRAGTPRRTPRRPRQPCPRAGTGARCRPARGSSRRCATCAR